MSKDKAAKIYDIRRALEDNLDRLNGTYRPSDTTLNEVSEEILRALES